VGFVSPVGLPPVLPRFGCCTQWWEKNNAVSGASVFLFFSLGSPFQAMAGDNRTWGFSNLLDGQAIYGEK